MAGTGAKKQDKELSFEAAMSRLEEIVRSLESGTAPLDESLTMFEEGVISSRSAIRHLIRRSAR